MEEQKKKNEVRLAVVRIRGSIGVDAPKEDTMKKLRLYRKNGCVVVKGNDCYVNMIIKIKDFVTWGEIDEETFSKLFKERARVVGNKKVTDDYMTKNAKMKMDQFVKEFMSGKVELKDVPGLKPFFRLSPPVKGFDRKGIKLPFSLGGALGYRKDRINDLVKRMI